jgi:hypothetical protein
VHVSLEEDQAMRSEVANRVVIILAVDDTRSKLLDDLHGRIP